MKTREIFVEEYKDSYLAMFYSFHSLKDYVRLVTEHRYSIGHAELELRKEDFLSPEQQYFVAGEMREYLSTDFLQLTTSAAMIGLYNRVELSLRRLCSVLAKVQNTPAKYSDFSGSPLEKTVKFLGCFTSTIVPDKAKDLFLRTQRVRDCFVHCGGLIAESRDSSYLGTLVSIGYLRLKDGYISIEIEPCMSTISDVFEQMDSLYRELGFRIV